MNWLQMAWIFLECQASDIWNRSKIAILAIVAVIFALFFNRIKEFVLAYLGQREINSDKKEDVKLATQEQNDKDKADALIQQAQQLPATEKPVDSDWYKK